MNKPILGIDCKGRRSGKSVLLLKGKKTFLHNGYRNVDRRPEKKPFLL